MLAEEGAHDPADRGLRAAATCHVVRPRADGRDLERQSTLESSRATRERKSVFTFRESVERRSQSSGTEWRRLELEGEDSVRRRVAARKKTRTRDSCWRTASPLTGKS